MLLNHKVTKLEFDGDRCVRVHVGDDMVYEPSAVDLLAAAAEHRGHGRPAPKPEVMAAARGLRYRDFLTVAVVLKGEDLFPDNWIYIHDPNVNVGRIQNFRSWSPWMVPDPTKACVGLEFFCFAGDKLWEMDDDELVAARHAELEQLGLAKRDQLEFGFVERVPKAYPMYDADYSERVHAIRSWLDGLDNFIQVGRNGLHRYNNSDHSMLTAMRAVDNLIKGTEHDIWAVNAESAYHEEENQDEQQPYIEGSGDGVDEGAAALVAQCAAAHPGAAGDSRRGVWGARSPSGHLVVVRQRPAGRLQHLLVQLLAELRVVLHHVEELVRVLGQVVHATAPGRGCRRSAPTRRCGCRSGCTSRRSGRRGPRRARSPSSSGGEVGALHPARAVHVRPSTGAWGPTSWVEAKWALTSPGRLVVRVDDDERHLGELGVSCEGTLPVSPRSPSR